jgi:glycosyltransferase involved in cell wall biosynthesis
MTTVGVTMVKDEADIIATTIRHMMTQVDFVVVANNMSTDRTPQILAGLGDEFPIIDDRVINHPDLVESRLLVVYDDDPAYEQSREMTGLAHLANRHWGADWIVPFDADELWYSPFDDRIADHLDGIASQWLTVGASLYDHVATADDPDIEDEPDPVSRLGYRRLGKTPLPKVACRWRDDLVIEMGNHAASYDGGTTNHDPVFVVRHFPYRSVDQLIRKVRNGAAAYKASDLDESYGAHWRQWGQLLDQSGPEAIEALFAEWYWSADPVADDTLMYDPAPVQR